jgi:hypothetical protein
MKELFDITKEDHIIFFDHKDPRKKYEGQTFRDEPHGKGRLEYKDGTVEEGNFDHGVFENKSKKKEPNKIGGPINTENMEPKNTNGPNKTSGPTITSGQQNSNLFRNIALSTASLGVAGVAYYMMKKKRKSRSKTSSHSSSSQSSSSHRHSKRNRKKSSRFR